MHQCDAEAGHTPFRKEKKVGIKLLSQESNNSISTHI
jgi:hypothetical protein